MTIIEAIKNRNSVRSYINKPIEKKLIEQLQDNINNINQKSGLNIQIFINEPNAFSGFMAHYGKFNGVTNYIALVGKKSNSLDESIGYYGEQLVIQIQQLGLNSCWVALTFNKGKCQAKVNHDEKLVCIIPFGYGENQGVPHKSKPIENLYKSNESIPNWFKNGLELAMLSPTAMNQQKFLFILNDDNTVSAKSTGGFYSKVDLGIVKYHFEVGANLDNFKWK